MEKTYLLASLTRSLDKFHLQNNYIHLLGSVFYTSHFDINNINYKHNNTFVVVRFFIDLRTETENTFNIDVIEHNNSLVEFRINLIYFIFAYNNPDNVLSKDNTVSSFVDGDDYNFITSLFGAYDLKNSNNYLLYKDKYRYNPNSILFVFEDIDWFNLKFILLLADIKLSSGSISKRHILSTTQFKLNMFLILFGYNDVDIYNSYVYLNNIKNNKDKLLPAGSNLTKQILTVKLPENIMKEFIRTKLHSYELVLNKEIDLLETDIKNKLSNINFLENSISDRKAKIVKANKNVANSKRVLNFEKKIVDFKKLLENNKNKISTLKSNLSYNLELANSIDTMSFEALKELYLNSYHRLKVSEDVDKFNNYLAKSSNLRYRKVYKVKN